VFPFWSIEQIEQIEQKEKNFKIKERRRYNVVVL